MPSASDPETKVHDAELFQLPLPELMNVAPTAGIAGVSVLAVRAPKIRLKLSGQGNLSPTLARTSAKPEIINTNSASVATIELTRARPDSLSRMILVFDLGEECSPPAAGANRCPPCRRTKAKRSGECRDEPAIKTMDSF